MKSLKYLFFLFCTMPCIAYGAITQTTPINVTGGVDYSAPATEITDNRAADAQNMLPNVLGKISHRQGSDRFISQAISTNPINSLYRASVDLGTTTKRVILASTWDRIYVSTSDTNAVWKELKRGLLTHNQHFSFANHNGIIVMTGDALTDPVYKYDISLDSFSTLFSGDPSTDAVRIRAKFVTASNGYLLLSNCLDVKDLSGNTTYYGSTVYYSLFNQISSFTYQHSINIKISDGESITGVTNKGTVSGNLLVFYKPSSITNLTFTILDVTVNGGDILVDTVANNFGCISPLALANAGDYDVVPSRDGLYLFNGGRKIRLYLNEETKLISNQISPIYQRTVKYGTYEKSVGVYYPKRKLYLYSFCDPFYAPQGRPNRVFILDLNTGEWWPQKNWLAGSFTTFFNDGSLFYGDSVDGYVYQADLDTKLDDARKEISLDPMDSTTGWLPAPTADTTTVVEGTSSLKIQDNFSNVYFSSMGKISLLSLGEWKDGSLISKNKDYLSFKLNVSSIQSLTSLRVDFQYAETISSFTQFFSSVTLTSSTLMTIGFSTGAFSEVKILLSSFTIPSEWTDPRTQILPFANSLTIYGIRFVATAVSTCTLYVDDVRVVGGGNSVVDAYYLTKQFNLGTVAQKDWRQVILGYEKSADSNLKIDIFTDFGDFANSRTIDRDIPKEIFVCGYKGTNGITRLKSTDLSIINSTLVANANTIDYMNGVANEKYVIAFDKVLNRFLMLDRSTPSVIISSFGSLGSGTTNCNTVNQMCLVDDILFATDNFNDRIIELSIKNNKLSLVRTFGELGTGSTNFFSPSGITSDKTHIWILDDGNFKIKKFTPTFQFESEVTFDANTISEGVLQNDGENLFVAYNKIVNQPYFEDVILEKRNKADMSLVQRTSLRPRGVVDQSTYTISGDFALLGPYIFVGFTKDVATTGTYYFQKLLKNGFDIVNEYSTIGVQFSIMGDSNSFRPARQSQKIDLNARQGTYLQLKYYTNEEDNAFSLLNYSFALDPKAYEEQKQ